MYILQAGMIECIDHGNALYFNNVKYEGTFPAKITLTVQPENFSISGISTTGAYTPFPAEVADADIKSLQEQIKIKLIPYQAMPPVSNPQTMEEVIAKSPQYFPYTTNKEELAVSTFDWTSANFTRIVYFRMFAYTLLKDYPLPLDNASITNAIWTSDWGDYNPSNEAYMNSFMMVPADTEESVATQLQQKAPTLYSYVNAEINLIAAALHLGQLTARLQFFRE